MAEQKRDYSSPYDELGDAFFATGTLIDDDGKTFIEETAERTRNASYAGKRAANFKYDDNYTRTNVYIGYRFRWDKEKKANGEAFPYTLDDASLQKMIACVAAHGYVVMNEDGEIVE